MQKFTGSGLVDACPTCESVFARVDIAEPAKPRSEVAAIPIAAPAKPVAAPSANGRTSDLIAGMRARLAFVETEIAARVKYDVERAQLKRMLAAAGETEADTGIVDASLAN